MKACKSLVFQGFIILISVACQESVEIVAPEERTHYVLEEQESPRQDPALSITEHHPFTVNVSGAKEAEYRITTF